MLGQCYLRLSGFQRSCSWASMISALRFFLHLSSSLAGRVTVVHTAHIRDRLGWCGVVLDVRLFQRSGIAGLGCLGVVSQHLVEQCSGTTQFSQARLGLSCALAWCWFCFFGFQDGLSSSIFALDQRRFSASAGFHQ